MKTLDVHLVQFSIAWEDQEKNYAKVLDLLGKNTPSKGSIICLPELFSTGYTMKAKKYSEKKKNSETLEFLKNMAVFYDCYVVGSCIIAGRSKKPANTAVVFSPAGKLIHSYEKIHLLPLGKEHHIYRKGNQISTFSIKGKTFSVLICFDLRFPELFRVLYEQDTDGVFVVANWPKIRSSHWDTLLKARAIENQMFVLGINRTGKDPKASYKGGSAVIDPLGKRLASSNKQEVISCKIDLDAPRKTRKELCFKKSRNLTTYKKFRPYKNS